MHDDSERPAFERPTDIWTYRARPDPHSNADALGVVDGDTYDLVVDLGFQTEIMVRIRAIHIDTAEIFSNPQDSDGYRMGVEQKEFVEEWFRDSMYHADTADDVPEKWPLLVRTHRQQGGFGRWLGEVFNWAGDSLERAIIETFGDEYLYQP